MNSYKDDLLVMYRNIVHGNLLKYGMVDCLDQYYKDVFASRMDEIYRMEKKLEEENESRV